MSGRVPILRIAFGEEDREFLHAGLEEILGSGQLTQGQYVSRFEEMFAEFAGCQYAIACSNGTAALEIIIRALGIEGQSILVPSNTFVASAFAVTHTGNQVIFVDSDVETLSLDLGDVERRIRSDTVALMLVHIGGIITPAVYDLKELCQSRGLYLIEDCAHAHGCKIDGKPAGTFGVGGAFSFFPTKVLVSGEGGMVVTDNGEVARRARMIRNHGKDPGLYDRMSEPGSNFRMDEFSALLGVHQMERAASLIEARRRVAAYYDANLFRVRGVRPLRIPENVFCSYYKYVAFLDERIDRNKLKQRLRDDYGVSLTGEVYAAPCHTEPVWQEFTYCGRKRSADGVACNRYPTCGCDEVQDGFPGADYISQHHVCLPIYPSLTEQELDYIVSSLAAVLADMDWQ